MTDNDNCKLRCASSTQRWSPSRAPGDEIDFDEEIAFTKLGLPDFHITCHIYVPPIVNMTLQILLQVCVSYLPLLELLYQRINCLAKM